MHCHELKHHLCCLPERPSPRDSYSRRTCNRIGHAAQRFWIDVEPWLGFGAALASWQDCVREDRRIPQISCPDRDHFLALEALAFSHGQHISLVTLRDRVTDAAWGALVLLRSDDPPGWHAHSALCSGEARLHFGMYLLFDSALDLFRD